MVFGSFRTSGLKFQKSGFFQYFHAFVTTLGEDLWSLGPAMIVTDFNFFGACYNVLLLVLCCRAVLRFLVRKSLL